MKKNDGFFLVETAMLLLFMFGTLIIAVQSYNYCLKSISRERCLSQALSCCEDVLLGDSDSVVNTGLIIHKLNQSYDDYTITEIQVVRDEKIIFNVVQIK